MTRLFAIPSRTRCIAMGCAASLFASEKASAHLVQSGISPFYDGVAHFFVSPDDVAVVAALAVFSGLTGRTAARRFVLAMPVAWLLGAAMGLLGSGSVPYGWLTGASMLVAGMLAAANPPAPQLLPALVGIALGTLHGFLNGRAMASTDTTFLAAVGIVAAAGITALLLGATASSLRVPWHRVAARVVGSWVAAIGLLAIAWNLRPGA